MAVPTADHRVPPADLSGDIIGAAAGFMVVSEGDLQFTSAGMRDGDA